MLRWIQFQFFRTVNADVDLTRKKNQSPSVIVRLEFYLAKIYKSQGRKFVNLNSLGGL